MPSNAGGIRAGRAFVELYTRDNALTAGLKAAERRLKAFGGAIAGGLSAALTAVGKIVAANPALVLGFAGAAAAVAGVGVGLVSLGAVISATGAIVTTFGAALGAVGTGLAFLLSPIGLITAGLVAGAAAWLKYSDSGGKALAWLGQQLAGLKATALQAFAGIADALKTGDISLAGQIFWAGLKVEWLKGVAYLKGVWADWGTAFVDVMEGAKYQALHIFTDLKDGVRAIWAELTAGLSGSWGDLIKTLLTTLNPLAKALEALGFDVNGLVQSGLDKVGLQTTAGPQAAIAAVGAENLATHQALNDQQAGEAADRRARANDALAKAEADLAQSRQGLADLTRKASIKANTVTGVVGEGAAPGGPGSRAVSTVGGLTEDVGQAVERAVSKVDVTGGFSAAALGQQGIGSSLAKDQVDQQKLTNDKLERIRGDLRNNRPTWA